MNEKIFTFEEKIKWLNKFLNRDLKETDLHGPGQFETEINQEFKALYDPTKTYDFEPLKFKKYSSIENTYRSKEIDRITEQGNSGGVWRLSEKVHGSNFSFWFDGTVMKCAKRTGFLGEGSSFYNWQDVRMVEKPKVIKLWKYLEENFKDLNNQESLLELVVYGEIFGGTYPHPDVPRDYNAMIVQKGIYYSPSNLFYCFDIKINGKLVSETTKGELCDMFDIFWDEPLFTGTFAECLNYQNTYITTIPKRLGLPTIENNFCEGNVIKPIEVKRNWAGGRVILKNKNEKFAEVTGKKSGKKSIKVPKEEIILSDAATKMLEILLRYVNENRLRSVLSKMEAITDKDFGKVIGNCQKDTIEDFLKDHREEFLSLDIKEQKYLPKLTGREWSNLVRGQFLNIIDNTF